MATEPYHLSVLANVSLPTRYLMGMLEKGPVTDRIDIHPPS